MRLQLSLLVLTVTSFYQISQASECGESTIPYSLEVLSNGQPVLGCARPKCFGWQPNGQQLPTTAKFFRIDQQSDGFLRDDPLAIQTFDAADPRVYSQQSATCDTEFQSFSCDSQDQWVGGIAPVMNAKANSIVAYKCCTYPPLRASTDRGIATVAEGQIVIGGEVKENDKQYAFDYISNIEKNFDEDGQVFYEVNIRRFSCLDVSDVDRSVAEVLNSENIIRHVNGQKPVVFQAPNVEVAAPIETGELVVPEGVVDGQEVVIEEIVEQQGFIQPETTIAPPPPPPSEFQPVQPPQGFQPQGFQPQPQGFQPQPQGFVQQGFPQPAIQQPVQFPVDGASNYGYMPMGFASPTTLQMYYCFPGDALVVTKSGGQKRMDEVEVGDWVGSLENNGEDVILTPVLYWLHRDPKQMATFIEFEVDSGERFALTEKHLVYISKEGPTTKDLDDVNANPVPAEQVQVGDYFYYATPRRWRSYFKVQVVNIRHVVKQGIYAPMTGVGHLLVNKIHTSCHSESDIYSLQSSFFKPVLDFKRRLLSYFQDILPNEESGLGIGANALLDVLDLIIPAKLIM